MSCADWCQLHSEDECTQLLSSFDLVHPDMTRTLVLLERIGVPQTPLSVIRVSCGAYVLKVPAERDALSLLIMHLGEAADQLPLPERPTAT